MELLEKRDPLFKLSNLKLTLSLNCLNFVYSTDVLSIPYALCAITLRLVLEEYYLEELCALSQCTGMRSIYSNLHYSLQYTTVFTRATLTYHRRPTRFFCTLNLKTLLTKLLEISDFN